MSRAATSKGTPRRKAIELRALEQAALRSTAGFRDLPRRQRREIIQGLYSRHGGAAQARVEGRG